MKRKRQINELFSDVSSDVNGSFPYKNGIVLFLKERLQSNFIRI